jgi:hypothetical protein
MNKEKQPCRAGDPAMDHETGLWRRSQFEHPFGAPPPSVSLQPSSSSRNAERVMQNVNFLSARISIPRVRLKCSPVCEAFHRRLVLAAAFDKNIDNALPDVTYGDDVVLVARANLQFVQTIEMRFLKLLEQKVDDKIMLPAMKSTKRMVCPSPHALFCAYPLTGA